MKFFTSQKSNFWFKALWEHHCNIRRTRASLEVMQLRKFRRFVSFVKIHSPYYRRIIEARGINPATCVPSDFPILTKRDVMENFDELVTDRCITHEKITSFLADSKDPKDLFEGRYHVIHTSGSSGNRGYFVFSREAWFKGSSLALRAVPLRWRQRIAYFGVTRGHFAGVSMVLTGNDERNRHFFDVRTFDVGEPLHQVVARLNAFQPHVLAGYATSLKALAEAQERGELHIRPVYLRSGAEPLLPDVKAYLERVFQVKVMNVYASSEHLYMGMTLPGSDDMHLMEDDLIFEIKEDHTCVTNLFNEAMPLIRYRMDDVLLRVSNTEDIYPFTRVKNILGRQEMALCFINQRGEVDSISSIIIVELFVVGLYAWQIVIRSETSFLVRAVIDRAMNPQECEATCERLREKFEAILDEKEMGNVRFDIEQVESLAIDPFTGKFRLIVKDDSGDLLTR